MSTLTTTAAPDEVDQPETEEEQVPPTIEGKEKRVRGKYDLSRFDKRVIALVSWLITIPGLDWKTISKQAGMAWEAVAAIAALRSEDQAEFRHRSGVMISLVLEAAGPGLLKRAAAGKLNAFEFKQLVDAWANLSAQATVRSEHTINITVTQAESELMRMIDVKAPTASARLYDTDRHRLTGVEEAEVMGSDEQKVSTLAALPAPDPAQPAGPDAVRESEETPPNSSDHV